MEMRRRNIGLLYRIEKRLKAIESKLSDIEIAQNSFQKLSTFRFYWGLAIAFIAIGTALVFIQDTPNQSYSGYRTIGSILVILSSIVMIWSKFNYTPEKFNKKRLLAGSVVVFVGLGLLFITAVFDIVHDTIYFWLKIAGFLILVIGLYVLVFSIKKKITLIEKIKRWLLAVKKPKQPKSVTTNNQNT